jgi:phage-related protein
MSNGTQLGIVDSSHFRPESVEIGVGHSLEIFNGSTNHGTGRETGNTVLFRNSGGEQRGSKAIYNAPDNSFSFTLGIDNFRLEDGYQGDPPTYATVTFSAARVAFGDNYRLADAAGLKLAFSKVEKGLREAGIKVDLAQAFLTRLDITKNVLTEENPKDYFPMLRTLPCKLKDEAKYAGSLAWGNGQQSVSIYDKRAQMVFKKRSVINIPNTIRFEQKFLKREKVKAYLGFDTGLDLINNLDHAEKRYKDSMEKNILKLNVIDYEITTAQQFVDELNALKSIHNYAVSSYLLLRGYQAIANSEASFLAAVEEVSGNKMAVWRAKKKLHELKMESMSLETPLKNKKSSSKLYEELKNKVLS